MIGTRAGRTVNYVPLADRALPEEQQTTIVLRTLSARVRGILRDRLFTLDARTQEVRVAPGTGSYDAVRAGVAGWENLRDPDDLEALLEPAFEMDGKLGLSCLTSESVDSISAIVDELAGEVLALNQIGWDDVVDDGADPTAASAGVDGSAPSPPSASSDTSSTVNGSDTTPPATSAKGGRRSQGRQPARAATGATTSRRR